MTLSASQTARRRELEELHAAVGRLSAFTRACERCGRDRRVATYAEALDHRRTCGGLFVRRDLALERIARALDWYETAEKNGGR